jgi:hypothetical protein
MSSIMGGVGVGVGVGVGCNRYVDKVFLELNDELASPSCTELAAVQVRYGLGLGALRTDISPERRLVAS